MKMLTLGMNHVKIGWIIEQKSLLENGDLIVVALRRRYPVLVTILLAVMFLPGCGGSTVDQSLHQAVTQLEIFSKSRSVVFWGTPSAELSDDDLAKLSGAGRTKQNQQEIRKIVTEQQNNFKQAMDNLKQFADASESNNLQAWDRSRAGSLLAAMLVYRANWGVDELALFDSRLIDLKNKIQMTCIEIEQLKAQQVMVQPSNYNQAVDQSKAAIAELKKGEEKTAGQLQKLNTAITRLSEALANTIKQRDALVAKVGQLSEKLNVVPAQKALDIQKIIGDLERERFKVLIQIERLQSGPMELPAELPVQVGEQTLKEIGGIKQLEQEKLFLETRLKFLKESIGSQETYLKSLQQQMQISGEKGTQLAKRLDSLTARLKEYLKAMDDALSQRATLVGKAEADAGSGAKYAQQADKDLKQFIGAVDQAKSKVPPGVQDNYLKGSQEFDSLGYTVGNIYVNAQLDKAKVISSSLRFMKVLVPILKRAQPFGGLPAGLGKFVENAPAEEKKLGEDLPRVLDQAVKQYDAVYKKASRGTMQGVVGTSLALALNQAAGLMPQSAKEFLAKAKEILDKIVPASTGGAGSEQSDPLLAPARQLKQELGL
jgi:uncharacterized phage infection (PIP) family protein YhgE